MVKTHKFLKEVKYMMQKLAIILGAICVAMGILGFVPGITSNALLLGVFHVNTALNSLHIVTGALAIWVGLRSLKASQLYFQVTGVVYTLLTVLGFLTQDQDILGIIANNLADVYFHIVIAIVALYAGFATKDIDQVLTVSAPVTSDI